uniref:Methyltransferase FkbM family n=1 Tax=Solibacter usitatus (strain Ellin6076) TaxID=234267 RepID=Q025U0_SOLUE
MITTRQTTQEQLEDLLREGVSPAVHREQTAFDELAGPFAKSIVLFGAGGLGRRTLAGLRRHGIEPLAFADNNPAAWGTSVEGITVFSPAEAASRFGDSAVFVVTVWGALSKDRMSARIGQLQKLGCRRVVSFAPLYWKYPEGLLPHYGADLPHKVHESAAEVRAAFELWGDEASRFEYLNQIRWRLHMDFDCLNPPIGHPIYFPQDLCPLSDEEVFVDCGAFDGDTLQLFLAESGAKFRKIVAFEPDPANFANLRENAARMPGADRQAIQVLHAATGARAETVCLKAEGTKSSVIGAVGVEVDCVTLDNALSSTVPTYLKMDIEGAEVDSLIGASRTIRDHAPVLAICCYHAQDHLWKIPLLIHSLNPGYRFFLRPHDLEMWDLVCYAIPAERLKHAVAAE